MSNVSQTRYIIFTAIGALQGLIFWLLADFATPYSKLFSLGAFAWIAGLTVMMAWTQHHYSRLLALALGNGLLFSLVTVWVLSQYPGEKIGDEIRFFTWFIVGHIAFYISLVFSQVYQESGSKSFNYPKLFQYAWNNVFILLLAGLFTLAYWLLIVFCVALFQLAGIQLKDFFYTTPFSMIT